MPIIQAATIKHTLIYFSVDITAMLANARFARTVNDSAAGEVEFSISGSELAALMLAAPDATLSRNDDIAMAIYAYAIAQGHIAGTAQ